jgi:hypothetical protein
MKHLKNKRNPFFILLFAALFVAGGLAGFFLNPGITACMARAHTMDEYYHAAVVDAMDAEESEIMPLVDITPESDMVTWNETGDILLLTWHKYPESYVPGNETTLDWGEVWTFTDKEIEKWYQENKSSVKDWNLRLKQLIGLPPDSEYTHFTALWVSPGDVLRPAYVTGIADDAMQTALPDGTDESYTEWFDGNIITSYYEGAYPWTRLGYTYDWLPDDTEYGLTEFIIKKGSAANVEFTLTTDEFIGRLDKQVN